MDHLTCTRPTLRLVDGAYWGISLCAAATLPATDLIFMTIICLCNHGMASLLRRSGDGRERHLQIQTYLSMACAFLAATVLEYPSIIPALRKEHSENTSNGNYDNNYKQINSPRSENDTETVACLISLAGLVFGHIYSVFFCEPPTRKSWAVTEDWVTACGLLTFLVQRRSGIAGWEASESMECSSNWLLAAPYLRIWLLYKVLRPMVLPGWNQEDNSASGLDRSKAQIMSSKREPSSTLLSDQVMKKSELQKPVVADISLLWQVGGLYFDLADFVDRHPGGKEALMLGRGRDCTALVMSYHPFSREQCWKILEKYQRFPAAANVEADAKASADSQSDFFYNLLCERVAKTLKDKGIDPIKDRGATVFRSLYYLLIAAAVVVSGFFHAKVCQILTRLWFT